MIGQPEVADLAGADEVVDGAHEFVDGAVLIPEVRPEQVDVVGLEAAEGFIDRGDHALAPAAAGVGVAREHVAGALGGDDESVAPGGVAADVVADDFFGVALGVDVGGVEEVAAAIEIGVDDFLGGLDIGAPAPVEAEGHGAEAEGADAEAGAAEGEVVV
ncbi:MAG: hypothetical protein K8E66_10680, partial [Phycisphaerales bacterium]|nr:hypothetical protein [Phycisphaerales bacterium]